MPSVPATSRLLLIVLGVSLVAVACVLLLAHALRAPPPPVQVAVELAAPERSPEEVERLVTAPLEEALATIPGLQGMESTSAPGGARVVLTLDPEAEEAARAQLRDQLAAVAPRLPGELPAPAVLPVEERVAFRWVVSGELLPPEDLFEAQVRASAELSGVPGVIAVESCGPRRELRVTVDPARAQAAGLVAGDVWKALTARAASWIESDDLHGVVVATRGGSEVRLRDVAQVGRGAPEGCLARGPQGTAVTGTAWMRAADAVAAGRALEARLRSMSLGPGGTLSVLGASPAFDLDVAGAPGSSDCLTRAATQLLGGQGWALEVKGGRARLAVDGRAVPVRELGRRVARALATCPGVAYAGIVGGAGDGTLLRVRVVGPELDVLDGIAADLRLALAGAPGARVLPAPATAAVLELDVDRERAERLGVPAEEMDRALALVADGVLAGSAKSGERIMPLRLRWGGGEVAVPDALPGVMVRGAGGAMLPVSELAALRLDRQRTILHDDRRRAVEIRVELEPGAEDGVRRHAREAIRRLRLPAGVMVHVAEEPRGSLEALRRRLTGR